MPKYTYILNTLHCIYHFINRTILRLNSRFLLLVWFFFSQRFLFHICVLHLLPYFWKLLCICEINSAAFFCFCFCLFLVLNKHFDIHQAKFANWLKFIEFFLSNYVKAVKWSFSAWANNECHLTFLLFEGKQKFAWLFRWFVSLII